LEINSEVRTNIWNEFLQGCEKATIYHTPEWKAVLESAFGYDSKYIFLVDDNEKVTGELPLFYVKSKLFGSHVSSLPFSHSCGYVGNESHSNEALDKAIQISEAAKSKYLEIRDVSNNLRFREVGSFYTHVLELSSKPEQVWSKLDKGSVRWAVKKSKQMGTTVSCSRNIEDLKEFYELNCMTKKDLGVPCHPWKFFKALFANLGESVSLYIVKYKGDTIAGGIMEYFKDTVLYGYGAANPKYMGVHPYNAFIWASIEDACSRGFSRFDFGRSSDNESGLRNFKKRWGTTEIDLKYSYHPQNASSALFDAYSKKSLLYDFAGFAIRHSPMWTYKKFSDAVLAEMG